MNISREDRIEEILKFATSNIEIKIRENSIPNEYIHFITFFCGEHNLLTGNNIENYNNLLIEMLNKKHTLFRGISAFYGLPLLGYILDSNKNFINGNDSIIKAVNNTLINLCKKAKWMDSIKDMSYITGLTGILRYLLKYKQDPHVHMYLKESTSIVVNLILNKNNKNFSIDYENSTDVNKESFTDGYIDFGVAHGISGILSVLSIELLNGIEVPGQKEAIIKLQDFLVNSSIEVCTNCVIWPSKLDINLFNANKINSKNPFPLSWCYGTSGINNSLYLSGQAINSREITSFATINMKNNLNQYFNDNPFISPTFCHGYSGLLLTLMSFYKHTKDSLFLDYINSSVDIIINHFNSNDLLGFSDICFNSYENIPEKDRTNFSFLSGSTSVLLTLISYLSNCANNSFTELLLIQ